MTAEGVTTILLVVLGLVAGLGGFQAWRRSPSQRALAVSMGLIAIGSLLMLAMGWRLHWARGSSMLPTMPDQSVLWVQRTSSDQGCSSLGAVVLFRSPQGASLLAKRVVARPGDHVRYQEGQLWVNGQPVVAHWNPALLSRFHRPGPLWTGRASPTLGAFEAASDRGRHRGQLVDVIIPTGHCFVMGDNWATSLDSRDFGPVAVSRIYGKVISFWPVDRAWTHP